MARTDGDLLRALARKRGVTERQIRRLAQKRKAELPMETSEAVYTIAAEAGIDITTYLDAEEVQKVRALLTQLRVGGGDSRPSQDAGATGAGRRRSAAPKPALVTLSGVNVERLPGMSAARAKEAKRMAEKVYPIIYVFENSARDLISAVLAKEIGEDWWDQVVPRRIREAARERKEGEGDDPWHGKRGASMIDYTMLTELPKIVGANEAWPHFRPIFARKSFFEELVNDMNVSRRVAAHMNPVSADDARHVEVAFRKWAKTLKARTTPNAREHPRRTESTRQR
jgi:hypothetical protein